MAIFWWLKQDLTVNYTGFANVGSQEHNLKNDIKEIRKELKALNSKVK